MPDKTNDQLEKSLDKSYHIVYGTDHKLDAESDKINKITSRVTANAIAKYNTQVPNSDLLGYTSTINFNNIFDAMATSKNKLDADKSKLMSDNFTDKMVELGQEAVGQLQQNNGPLNLAIDNYDSMVKLIPECSLALKTYIANIISPDDYTKKIFDVKYKSNDSQKMFEPIVENVINKYKLKLLCTDIVRKTLTYGKHYVAVLQYTDEFNKMLSNKNTIKNLNENASLFTALDKDYVYSENINIDSSSFNKTYLDKNNITILENYLNIKRNDNKTLNENVNTDEKLYEKDILQIVSNICNKNVIVGSKVDLLRERYDLEAAFNVMPHKSKSSKSRLGVTVEIDDSSSQIFVNGSAIRQLDLKKLIKIEADGVCYGYYYIETDDLLNKPNTFTNGSSLYTSVSNAPVVSVDVNHGSNAKPESQMLGITDAMYDFITNVFIDGISSKLNKKFLNNNKNFKDLIYSLVKHKYIKDKAIKITYFRPSDVVEFDTGSIFENSVYVAKLYLATLTNDIIIKLGRAHDKRVFYVKSGLDKQYAATIQKAVMDIKTKDVGFNDLNSINSTLSLSSGRFHDYFIPELPDGTRGVQMETFAGMNTNESTELLEFFRKALINTMHLPASYIADMAENIEFARNITSMNAEFLRIIIDYQLKFNESFTEFLRKLISNEKMYNADGAADKNILDVSEISVLFKSPGALQYTNLLEQINNISAIADTIVAAIDYSDDMQGARLKNRFKGKIIQEMIGSAIDWNRYRELYIESKTEESKQKTLDVANSNNMGIDTGGDTNGY